MFYSPSNQVFRWLTDQINSSACMTLHVRACSKVGVVLTYLVHDWLIADALQQVMQPVTPLNAVTAG